MKYLIYYSIRAYAKKDGLPPECSTVELNTLEDLHKLTERFDDEVIIHKKGFVPTQYDPGYLGCGYNEEDFEEQHITALPEGWENMPWLEIYNGWRE